MFVFKTALYFIVYTCKHHYYAEKTARSNACTKFMRKSGASAVNTVPPIPRLAAQTIASRRSSGRRGSSRSQRSTRSRHASRSATRSRSRARPSMKASRSRRQTHMTPAAVRGSADRRSRCDRRRPYTSRAGVCRVAAPSRASRGQYRAGAPLRYGPRHGRAAVH